ncbi:MAG TPA: thioredoxin domain-containing protein [Ktedonobacteraceae bacterium]|jgi:thioredoxin 1|nr:thioredoxin domain-containing protein [Ktedonobacteraceae bacterium]
MADQTASYATVGSEDFAEKVLQAPEMVVVNFSSDKSESCQLFEPEFAAIGQEYQGRAIFARINVDDNAGLVSQYNVDGIPTVIFFKNGQEINRIKGIVMRDKLRRQVAGALLVGSYSTGGEDA